ncbi:MAG: hypothetical protein HKO65_11895 [Gemmatimonadetes bacterium]|nr:hypothetical protein [Gemmatimonadota bacterium]NNM05781.1 hypothetical protein [Gemmatimonadota bacterium]
MAAGCCLVPTACPFPVVAQEDRIVQLEFAHEQAEANYEATLAEVRGREVQYATASQAFDEALARGNEEETNRAYVASSQALGMRTRAERQLEERAQELREARRNLLEARRIYGEDLLAQAASENDPVVQRTIAVFVENNSLEIARLRLLPEPEITLEPLPEYDIEERDGPVELRQKAGLLEFAANRYEEQQTYFQQQLAELLQDQDLFRRSGDFLADRSRFGDRPPVGAQAGQNVPPPEQLDQQIQELETLQEELTRRIETIRTRAAELRRLAGGEWAQ